MKKYKIGVYAICKNEAHFVDSWMASMQEADVVVVTDTGSEDNTVERLREKGAVVYTETISPWRFDVARNRSLDHVPEDIDICVCTDLDELFEVGWRKKLEEAWRKDEKEFKSTTTRKGKYIYNWSLKADGSPDVQFQYFKVHERKGFKWIYPVHECLEYTGKNPLRTIFVDGMVLNHYPDSKKSRGSYLPLLELGVKEMPENDRMRYYLGREYMYKFMWNDCINTLKDYLELPSARWNEERCAAMRWIAKSYKMMGNFKDAYKWYYRAIAECPKMRDPFVEFSRLCYEQKDWPMTFFLTKEALKITEKSSTYVNMGYSWDHTPYDLCAIAAYRLNIKETALLYAQKALSITPEDERLKNNFALILNDIKNSK